MSEVPSSSGDVPPTSLPVPGTGWGDPEPPSGPRPDHAFATLDEERYQLGPKLGEGGMGTVYSAWDARLRRTVAIKFAVPGSAAEDRLSQEAWIAAQLEHPAIVPIYDAGIARDGRRFVVLRYLRGRTLRELLHDAPAPRLDLLPVLRRVCEGLAHAHQAGIVHRDLTPSNVLVGAFGEVQILDWGLARPFAGEPGESWTGAILPEADAAKTRAGVVLGTPGYMSPEQAVGAPVDPRADVWALGAMAYEMMTGHPPFGELEDDNRQRAIATEAVPDLRVEVSDVRPVIAALITDALQRQPDARPATARAFLHRLEQGLASAPAAPPRRSRVPFALVPLTLVGVTAAAVGFTGGWMSRPGPADDSLDALLHTWAAQEARSGAFPEAELRAAVATARDDRPSTRGWLAHLRAGVRPSLERGAALPRRCSRTSIAPHGDHYLCVIGQDISYHSLDGFLVWERSLSAPVRTLANGDDHLVFVHPDSRVVVIQRETGDILGPLLSSFPVFYGGDTGSEVWLRSDRGLLRASTLSEGASQIFQAPPESSKHALPTDLDDGTLVVADTREVWWKRPDSGWVSAGTWSSATPNDAFRSALSDGQNVILLSRSGALVRWRPGQDLNAAARVQLDPNPKAVSVAPDGDTVLVVGADGTGRLIDWTLGAVRARLPALEGANSALLDDHTVRVAGDHITTWRLPEAGPWPAQMPTESGGVTYLATQGGRLAWSGAGAAEVLDPRGVPLWSAASEGGVFKAASLSPDGRRVLVIGSQAGRPRLHDLIDGTSREVPRVPPNGRRAVWLGPDHFAIVSYAVGNPWVFTADALDPLKRWTLPRQTLLDLQPEVAPGRGWGLTPDRRLVELDLAQSAPRISRPLSFDALAVVRDTSGPSPWVVTHAALNAVDPKTGDLMETLDVGDGVSAALQLSTDRFATGHADGSVKVWRRDGTLLMAVRAHGDRVASLVREGEILLSGSWDGTILSWDLPTLDASPATLVDDAVARWGLDPKLAHTPPG